MTPKNLKIIFMGSPDFAVPSLRLLHQHHCVLAVVTQPDRPQGRGRAIAPPPVKVLAQELGLPVLQPEKLRRRSVREEITSFGADLFVVTAYGKILSAKMLAAAPMGCVNVHASLLPKYRGAAPIQWAVIRGEKQTGITIMQMDPGMDTGPIYIQETIDLAEKETAGSLHDRLAPLGAELLIKALEGISKGTLKPIPQDDEKASLAPMLKKSDGLIDFTQSGQEVDCRIRGFDPWPGAFTFLDGTQLKLFQSYLVKGQHGNPGEVLYVDRRGLFVACSQDVVCIQKLQLPGRLRITVDIDPISMM